MGNPICTLDLRGELRSCDGATLLTEIRIADRKALRGDGRDPLATLLQRMTPQLMSGILAEQLKPRVLEWWRDNVGRESALR